LDGNVAVFAPEAKLGMLAGELGESNVTLWVTPVVFIHVTVEPAETVMLAGSKVFDVVMHTVPFPGVQTVVGGVGGFTGDVESLPPHATSATAMTVQIERPVTLSAP